MHGFVHAHRQRWARAEVELAEGGRARLEWLNGDGTRLTLTVTAEAPDDHLASVRAGWQVHIDFLEDALDGRPVDWPNWPQDRWQVHFERYEATMRPIS